MLALHFEMGPRGKRSKTATRSFDGESLRDYASERGGRGRRDDGLRERKSQSEVTLSPASEDVTPFSVFLRLHELTALAAPRAAVRIDGFFVSESHFISAQASLIFPLSSAPSAPFGHVGVGNRQRKWISIAPGGRILKLRRHRHCRHLRVARRLAGLVREANYCHLPEGGRGDGSNLDKASCSPPNFWRHVHYPEHHCVESREKLVLVARVGLQPPSIHVGLAPNPLVANWHRKLRSS